ncbi:MAG: tRNA (adenosine(37)-N6)-threonylcarbamoyltransferase complex ATPase subunit type 1 TsaE [bacterium]
MKKPKSIVTHSPEETIALGEKFARGLRPGFYVALCGELGSGKTTFTKGIARGLRVTATVLSPTFQLAREYEGRFPLFHLDFYRLGSHGEAEHLDIAGYLDRGVVVAEWADRFPEIGSENFIELSFEWLSENERRIEIIRSSEG